MYSTFATPRSDLCMTTATNGAQPRTPRARHRHNKSTAQDADSVAPAENGQSRNNNQRRNNNQQSHQTMPAWEEAVIHNDLGDFDANGNFVSVDSLASGKKQGNRRQQKPRKDFQPEISMSSQSPLQVHAGNTLNHIAQPQPIKPDTPAKSIAYAGPTFHASPAPSALPMPKFFSKSVPASSQQPGLQARLDQETQQSPALTKQLTPPRAVPVLHEPARDTASPLDMFFKADREERAKQSHASTQMLTPPSKPALPVPQTEPAQNSYWSQIYGQGQKRHSRHASNSSGRDMFMMELDNSSGPQRPGPSPHSPRGEPSRSATSPSSIPQYQSIAPPSDVSGRAAPTPSHASQLNNIVPMTAPHDSRFQNGAHSAAHEASPFYRPDMQQQYPRSAGNTPVPQHNGSGPNVQDQQHLHYGNKNLSPLFKAARMAPGYADSPAIRRTSSLRQEVGADDGASLQNGRVQHESGYSSSDQNITSSNDILGRLRALQPQMQPKAQPSQHHQRTPSQQARPTSSGNPAHDAAALNYLQHSINQQPFMQGPPPQHFSQPMHYQNHHSSAPQFHQHATPPSKPANVASMEADLKRMLNLGGAPLG